MYGLRKINNNYEGGLRGDFVVIGHPEYNLGREASSGGYSKEWDTTGTPVYPKRSPAADRLRRSGSAQLWRHLREVPTEPRPGLKERAAKRSASAASVEQAKFLQGDVRLDFDEFMKALKSPDLLAKTLPTCRVEAGCGNHIGTAGGSRHYEVCREEIEYLCDRMRRDPVGTERDLLVSDSWRYWAKKLEQARRRHRANQQQLRRSNAAAAAHRFHGPPMIPGRDC